MAPRTRPRFTFTSPDQPPRAGSEGASPSVPPSPTAAEALPARQAAAPGAGRAPSRAGKRAVTFYVSPEAFRQVAVLAATQDRSVQDLMVEATDLLFQQHRLARIARSAADGAPDPAPA